MIQEFIGTELLWGLFVIALAYIYFSQLAKTME